MLHITRDPFKYSVICTIIELQNWKKKKKEISLWKNSKSKIFLDNVNASVNSTSISTIKHSYYEVRYDGQGVLFRFSFVLDHTTSEVLSRTYMKSIWNLRADIENYLRIHPTKFSMTQNNLNSMPSFSWAENSLYNNGFI